MDTKNLAGKTGLTAAWEETFSKIKSLFDNLTLPWSKITSAPTTVGGYGITDVYTKTEVDSAINAEAAALGAYLYIDEATGRLYMRTARQLNDQLEFNITDGHLHAVFK